MSTATLTNQTDATRQVLRDAAEIGRALDEDRRSRRNARARARRAARLVSGERAFALAGRAEVERLELARKGGR